MSGHLHVIGCDSCSWLWIIDRSDDVSEPSCPRCGHRHRTSRKALASAADVETARDLRAALLAERPTPAGGASTFGIEDSSTFGELADRVEEMTATDVLNARLEDTTGLDAEWVAEMAGPQDLESTDERFWRQRVEQSMDFSPVVDGDEDDHQSMARAQDPLIEQAGLDADAIYELGEAAVSDDEPDVLVGDPDADVDDPAEQDARPERPPGQSRAGLQLVTTEDTPPNPDIVVSDVGPRMSEWLGDWTERAFAATSETVLDLIQEHAPGVAESKRLPRSVITRLRDAYGIDARDGRYIEALAKWAVYFAPQATLDTDIWGARETKTRRERLEEQRQDALGVGRPGSDRYRGLDDFARGPLRVHAFDGEPLTTVVQLDTEAWLDIDRRETAIRALQALGAIACSSRVFIEVDSLALFDSLTERFGDHLEMAGVDLSETRDRVHRRCDVSGTTATPADAEIVWSWLTDTRDDTSHVHVVKALSRSPQKTLTREELLHDTAVGFGIGSFYAVKDALVDAGLVEWVKRSGHDQSSRVVLTPAGELAAKYITPEFALRDPLSSEISTRLTAHHIADAGAVGSRSQRSGGEPPSTTPTGGGAVDGPVRRESVEDWLARASAAGFDSAEFDDYCHWLDGPGGAMGPWAMHIRQTAPAREPGVHLVDDPIPTWNGRRDDCVGDGRASFISAPDNIDDEFLVVAQASLDPLITLGRLANALLDNRVATSVLSKSEVGTEFERLYDGAWGELTTSLESIADVHDHMRDAVQIGWKGNEQRTWDGWRERYGGLRPHFNKRVAEFARSDDFEQRGELMKDLHGVIASMTQLLFASGRHVYINLRVPQTWDLITDELYRQDFLTFLEKVVPKQAVYQTDTGWHSWTRWTQEERPEKLQWRQALRPSTDSNEANDLSAYPTADLTASWILTGPTMTEFEGYVRRAVDAGVRDRSDNRAAPPALEIPVRNASSTSTIRAIVEDLARRKQYRVADQEATPDEQQQVEYGDADDISRLLRVIFAALGREDAPLSASPHDVAELMLRLKSSDRSNDLLTVRDIERGLSRLPPDRFLPELGPVASSMIQELLRATEPLLPSEVVRRSISHANPEEKRPWEENLEEFSALGIVEERSTGRNQHYTATLEPWWSPSTASSRPPNVPEEMVASVHEHAFLYEISCSLGLDVDSELFVWTDTNPDLDAIYDASDRLRRWRPLVHLAFVGREDLVDLPPPDARDSDIVVIGRYPDDAKQPAHPSDELQQSLSETAPNGVKSATKPLYSD